MYTIRDMGKMQTKSGTALNLWKRSLCKESISIKKLEERSKKFYFLRCTKWFPFVKSRKEKNNDPEM